MKNPITLVKLHIQHFFYKGYSEFKYVVSDGGNDNNKDNGDYDGGQHHDAENMTNKK